MWCLTLEGDNNEESTSEANAMPTGHVVGVLQKNWRDYVCSFAEDEVRLFTFKKENITDLFIILTY